MVWKKDSPIFGNAKGKVTGGNTQMFLADAENSKTYTVKGAKQKSFNVRNSTTVKEKNSFLMSMKRSAVEVKEKAPNNNFKNTRTVHFKKPKNLNS